MYSFHYYRDALINQCEQGSVLEAIRSVACENGRQVEVLNTIQECAPLNEVEKTYLNHYKEQLQNSKANESFIYVFLRPEDMQEDKPRKDVLGWLVNAVNRANAHDDFKFESSFALSGMCMFYQKIQQSYIPTYLIEVRMPSDLGRYKLVGEVVFDGANNQLGSAIEFFNDKVYDKFVQKRFDLFRSAEMQNYCTDCGVRRYRTEMWIVEDSEVAIPPRVLIDEDGTPISNVDAFDAAIEKKYQMLGSACLKKYIPATMLKLLELIQAMRARREEFKKSTAIRKYKDIDTTNFTFKTLDILAAGCASYRYNNRMLPEPDRGKRLGTFGQIFSDFITGRYVEVAEEDYAKAAEVIEFARNCDDTKLSETVRSALQVARKEYCTTRVCKFLYYLMQHHRKETIVVAQPMRQAAVHHKTTIVNNVSGQHYGQIGDHVRDAFAKITFLSSWRRGNFGMYRIVRFQCDDSAAVITTFSNDENIYEGVRCTASFVIQKHSDYYGELQTLVGKCKFEVEEIES